ncbi:hypothetical protein JIQ42_06740 [Leishmania sp. Namibia]|uniref:hypothetical protein n=1 Tax=Leishmania sp. Namibia TaxID=2802991 RepID=UPI001B42F033|nr:hypothetical protein JIQ42_06740 [Leishmania sp. Namibia]
MEEWGRGRDAPEATPLLLSEVRGGGLGVERCELRLCRGDRGKGGSVVRDDGELIVEMQRRTVCNLEGLN